MAGTVATGTDHLSKGRACQSSSTCHRSTSRLRTSLRARIVGGELRPGDEVPSERQVAADWNVSRPTATKALDVLRREGHVEGGRAPARSCQSRADSIGERTTGTSGAPRRGGSIRRTNGLRSSPPSASRRPITSPRHWGYPPTHLSFVDCGSSCGTMSQSSCRPRGTTPRWQARHLAILERDRIREGTVAYVEGATGRRARRARDRISARLASDDEAGLPGARSAVRGAGDEPSGARRRRRAPGVRRICRAPGSLDGRARLPDPGARRGSPSTAWHRHCAYGGDDGVGSRCGVTCSRSGSGWGGQAMRDRGPRGSAIGADPGPGSERSGSSRRCSRSPEPGDAVPAGGVRGPDRYAVCGDHRDGRSLAWSLRATGMRAPGRVPAGAANGKGGDGGGADGVADRPAHRRTGPPLGHHRSRCRPRLPARPAVPVSVQRVTTGRGLRLQRWRPSRPTNTCERSPRWRVRVGARGCCRSRWTAWRWRPR